MEKLKAVLAMELMAQEKYKEDILNFHNEEIIRAFTEILVDEEKHVQLMQSLVNSLG